MQQNIIHCLTLEFSDMHTFCILCFRPLRKVIKKKKVEDKEEQKAGEHIEGGDLYA